MSVERIANLAGSSVPATGAPTVIPQHVAITKVSDGSVIESFGGGVQYTEGTDTDSTPSGTVVMWKGAANAIVSASQATPLPVEPIGADTFAANQVSVAATATLIVAARTGRRAVGVIQHGTTAVYLGPTNGVTTSNGLLLAGTAGTGVVLDYSGDVYGIVASGTQTVSYAEEY